MKKLLSLCLATLVLLGLSLPFAACSGCAGCGAPAFETVDANFLAAGYTAYDAADAVARQAIGMAIGDYDDGDPKKITHFYRIDTFVSAVVFEYASPADAERGLAAYRESDAAAHFFYNIAEPEKLLRGNCLLLPLSTKAEKRNEMVDIFSR